MRRRDREVPAWYTEEQRFVYPTRLEYGIMFKSMRQLIEFLTLETAERSVSIGPNDYKAKYENKDGETGEWKRMRLICKICDAQLNFGRRGGDIMTMKINTNHVHGPKQAKKRENMLKKKRQYMKARKQRKTKKKGCGQPASYHDSQVEESQQESEQEVSRRDPLRTPERQESDDSENSHSHKTSNKNPDIQVQTPARDSNYPRQLNITTSPVQNWLIDNHYTFYIERNQARGEDEIFLLVAANQLMRKDYARYGDALYFEVVEGALKSRFGNSKECKAGLFTVVDCNDRPLIVGFAIFQTETAECMLSMLEQFMVIHRKQHPRTLVTVQSQAMQQAVEQYVQLSQQQFNHLINPWHAIRQFLSKFHGSTQEVAFTISKLKLLIHERDPQQYERTMGQLVAVCNKHPDLVEAIRQLQRDQIFYLTTKDAFVGLSRNHSHQFERIVRQVLPKRVSLMHLLDAIQLLSAIITRKSIQEFDHYPQEVPLGDRTLERFVRMMQNNPAQRLIENYFKAAELKPIGKHHSTKPTIYEQKHTISKGQCSCREFEKTGIACPHLIKMAISSKQYKGLVHARWLRQCQQENRPEL